MTRTKRPWGSGPLSLAAFAAERALLLQTLTELDWNLRQVALRLKLVEPHEEGTGNLSRALHRLAPEEYRRARADGVVVPGRRRKGPRATSAA